MTQERNSLSRELSSSLEQVSSPGYCPADVSQESDHYGSSSSSSKRARRQSSEPELSDNTLATTADTFPVVEQQVALRHPHVLHDMYLFQVVNTPRFEFGRVRVDVIKMQDFLHEFYVRKVVIHEIPLHPLTRSVHEVFTSMHFKENLQHLGDYINLPVSIERVGPNQDHMLSPFGRSFPAVYMALAEEKKRLELFSQLVESTDQLHCVGRYLHGDIKGDNVIVQEGKVKLIDFGLSLAMDSNGQAEWLSSCGSEKFKAPELWPKHQRSYTYSVATEMYALGRTLWWLEVDLGQPSDRIKWIVEQCCAKLPEDRWSLGRLKAALLK